MHEKVVWFKITLRLLASRIGSLKEAVIGGETGFLFEAGDADDLIRAARRMPDREAYARLRAGARKRYEAQHTPQQHYQRLILLQ